MKPHKTHKNSFYSAVGYRAFDPLMAPVTDYFRGCGISFLGYSRQMIVRRCAQQFTSLNLIEFLKTEAECHGKQPSSSLQGESLNLSGMSINPAAGKVSIHVSLFVKSLRRFCFLWIAVLAVHLLALCRFGNHKKPPVTILRGVGAESLIGVSGDDSRFVHFCKEGPIDPLRDFSELIVETPDRISSTSSHITYTRRPYLHLVLSSHLSVLSFLIFLVHHIAALFAYIQAIVRMPFMVTLEADFAFHAMFYRLNRDEQLRDIVLSNACYTAQELCMTALPERSFQTHMVWYSMNNFPFVYNWNTAVSDIPGFRYIAADDSWVWTEESATYFQQLGISGNYHVVGPVLWYLPEKTEKSSSDVKRIAVFGVTPLKPELEERYGFFHDYNCRENAKKFLMDIVRIVNEVAGERPVEIIMKDKRKQNSIHDTDYIDLVNTMERDGTIKVVEPNTNMYSIIDSCQLTIVMPYSSPAYVAASMGTPAVFYDPTGDLFPKYEEREHITYCSNEYDLQKSVAALLN